MRMNDTVQSDADQPQQPVPPPVPSVPSDNKRRVAVFNQFLVTHFWWVVGGAAGIKLISYFISPAGNATAGYHFVKLLIGFVSYGGILALVAFIISKCMKTKRNVFRIAFAILFALACLCDLPTAVMRSRANAAVSDLLKSAAGSSSSQRKSPENPRVAWSLREQRKLRTFSKKLIPLKHPTEESFTYTLDVQRQTDIWYARLSHYHSLVQLLESMQSPADKIVVASTLRDELDYWLEVCLLDMASLTMSEAHISHPVALDVTDAFMQDLHEIRYIFGETHRSLRK